MFNDARFIDEASVDRPVGYVPRVHHWGELKMDVPLELEEALRWMHEHYPDDVPPQSDATGRVNSCGLHVHVSVMTPAMYAALMRKGFHTYFLQRSEDWAERMKLSAGHEFWGRWRGENRFCRREHRAAQQAAYRDKGHNRQDRRTQINYTWKYLQTVECRMFPMFPEPALSESAIRLYVDCVEKWVSSNGAPIARKGKVLIPKVLRDGVKEIKI